MTKSAPGSSSVELTRVSGNVHFTYDQESTVATEDADEETRVRLFIDLPCQDATLLKDLSRQTRYNKTTTVIRALRVLRDLLQVLEGGGQVILARGDGSRQRLLLR